MSLEYDLATAAVRVEQRLPDVHATLLEALFALRRQHWVATPHKRFRDRRE